MVTSRWLSLLHPITAIFYDKIKKRSQPIPVRDIKLWIGRALIGVVLGWNVECALAFLISPKDYAPAFGLAGVLGNATLRGIGILFLMWNIPYLVALLQPRRHRLSLYEAVAMQAIGFSGESLLFLSLPADYAAMRALIARFMFFDGAGLVILLLSVWVTYERDYLCSVK
jgi:hypothetical protein